MTNKLKRFYIFLTTPIYYIVLHWKSNLFESAIIINKFIFEGILYYLDNNGKYSHGRQEWYSPRSFSLGKDKKVIL